MLLEILICTRPMRISKCESKFSVAALGLNAWLHAHEALDFKACIITIDEFCSEHFSFLAHLGETLFFLNILTRDYIIISPCIFCTYMYMYVYEVVHEVLFIYVNIRKRIIKPPAPIKFASRWKFLHRNEFLVDSRASCSFTFLVLRIINIPGTCIWEFPKAKIVQHLRF